MVRVINKGNVVNDTEIKILIEAVIIGRLGDYPVRGIITLSPY
ncbi:hypothetical protein [Vulcanisaeta sp. JCM 16159]